MMMMHNPQNIRVLIVDDHEMVRKGLGLFIDGFDDLELAGEAANGRAAALLCDQLRPDVVLMDLIMPDGDGVQAIMAIHERHPCIKIIALTSFRDEQLVAMALRAGAIGFLYKDIGVNELAAAIHSAYQGKPILSADATQILLRLLTQQDQTSGPAVALTLREQQVLMLMTQGMTNRQIAAQMHISPATVKQYVSAILSKLGAASRTEAVAQALKLHLVAA
jgi:NarL family two-component system response regulator LiaR